MQADLSAKKRGNPVKEFLSRRGVGQIVSVSVALALMFITFALLNERFMTQRNITELLRQISPILIIGIGQSYVLITAGIDLSIGSVVGMSSMLSATLMTKGHMNPVFATLITMACCLTVGVVNGTLISRAKLPPFIATLGTMIIARGVAQWANNNRNTDGIASQTFRNLFYYGKFLNFYAPLWIALILFIVFNFVLARTRAGRHIYAIGSNYEAAKFSGVSVEASQTTAYVISSFTACVVGLILTAMSGMGAMDAGNGYELNAVAASVIGGVSTMGGQGLLFGTVIGACIWGVLQNGLQFAGAPQALKNIVIGVVVIISVLIDRVARGNIVDMRKVFGRRAAHRKTSGELA